MLLVGERHCHLVNLRIVLILDLLMLDLNAHTDFLCIFRILLDFFRKLKCQNPSLYAHWYHSCHYLIDLIDYIHMIPLKGQRINDRRCRYIRAISTLNAKRHLGGMSKCLTLQSLFANQCIVLFHINLAGSKHLFRPKLQSFNSNRDAFQFLLDTYEIF